jgi:hypothetical protein
MVGEVEIGNVSLNRQLALGAGRKLLVEWKSESAAYPHHSMAPSPPDVVATIVVPIVLPLIHWQ